MEKSYSVFNLKELFFKGKGCSTKLSVSVFIWLKLIQFTFDHIETNIQLFFDNFQMEHSVVLSSNGKVEIIVQLLPK